MATPQSYEKEKNIARNYFQSSADATLGLKAEVEEIVSAARTMATALKDGKKIMFCGNGGSAADAQHLAAELVGRFQKERQPLAGMALTVDTSIITAISNDYAFSEIYARQVMALGLPGDVLFAMTTSVKSENVNKAIYEAKARGLSTIVLTSESAPANEMADHSLKVPSKYTWHVQEASIAVGHLLCVLIEDLLGLHE